MFTLGQVKSTTDQNGTVVEQVFTLDVLPAYAIDHASLIVNGLHGHIDGTYLAISGDKIVHRPGANHVIIESDYECQLQIFYHGIRDYSLLFPRIAATDQNRAERLGKYYQEAEVCFDDGAWLSFALMSGAIFEHMLYHKLSGSHDTLASLTQEAATNGVITQQDAAIIDNVRKFRNVIHCNKMNIAYITRAEAMDVKTLIDRLVLTL